MEEEQKNKLKYLIKKKKSIKEMCEALEINEYELIGMVEKLKEEGNLVDYVNGEIIILKRPANEEKIYQIPNDLEKLKLLLISDTHLCSKYDRLDILRYLYDKAEELGVKHVLHSGDFTDGRSSRPEHVYELKELSYQGQVDYCVDKYPQFSGKTYVIQGNHDNWWYKSNGSEIVKAIANQRQDIEYLGADVGNMKIGNLDIRLFHGSGNVAYAKSYKVQKVLDQIPLDERPDIFQTGHIHQAFYMKQDKTHCFQTGCLEDITPYVRGLGFNGDKSCWWADVEFDDKGQIHSITPTLEEFGNKLIRRRYKK